MALSGESHSKHVLTMRAWARSDMSGTDVPLTKVLRSPHAQLGQKHGCE